MVGERHALLVNGQRVPLHSTGVRGEYVAGIRFRAWQPPSCLHPTIPADGPLVFDLVDCWMKRAVAGCTYHVTHPGGRSSETSPINDREAEGRRNGRFSPLGHTPGKRIKIPEALTTSHFPLTLDMRQGAGVNGGGGREVGCLTLARAGVG